MWYHLFKYLLVGPLLWLVGRPTVEGREHLPRTGPVIVAANHLAVVDSLFLALVIRRRITFVAKSEYFTGTGIKGRLIRWFYSETGQVPIDRRGADAAESALRAAESILDNGGIWAIHPEGTRSPDGRLYRGRTGVMRVALRTGAPVVPVVLSGTERINPPGSRRWRFGKVRITICPPLDLSAHGTSSEHRPSVRAATNQLMAVLHANSGQVYVDEYATRAKSLLPESNL